MNSPADVRLNSCQQLAVRASLQEGVGGIEDEVNDSGLWRFGPNESVLIAQLGDTPPGHRSAMAFEYFDLAAITDSGHVVFGASYIVRNALGYNPQYGYWLGSEDGLVPILEEGDDAPGVPGETVLTVQGDSTGVFVNSAGDVVFDVIFSNREHVLYLYRDGRLEPILGDGQTIGVQGEDAQTVRRFEITGAECSSVGPTWCPLSDSGQLALLVNTESTDEADDSVFRITLSDVDAGENGADAGSFADGGNGGGQTGGQGCSTADASASAPSHILAILLILLGARLERRRGTHHG